MLCFCQDISSCNSDLSCASCREPRPGLCSCSGDSQPSEAAQHFPCPGRRTGLKDTAVVLALLLCSSSSLHGSGHSHCSDSPPAGSSAYAPQPPPRLPAGLTAGQHDLPVLHKKLGLPSASPASLISVSGQCTALVGAAQSPWGYPKAAAAEKQLRNEHSASFLLKRPGSYPYLEWGHFMCSHSFRCASRFIFRRGGQLGLLGQRTGL